MRFKDKRDLRWGVYGSLMVINILHDKLVLILLVFSPLFSSVFCPPLTQTIALHSHHRTEFLLKDDGLYIMMIDWI